MGGKQDSILDGGDCPPPGWEYGTLSQALPAKPQSNTAGHIYAFSILSYLNCEPSWNKRIV